MNSNQGQDTTQDPLSSTNPIYTDLSSEFELFCNESPFPLHALSLPLPNESIEQGHKEYKEMNASSEKQSNLQQRLSEHIMTLNKYTSEESGDTEITPTNIINTNNDNNYCSRFMPSIEPWKCNQIGSNHDNVSSIFMMLSDSIKNYICS